ncbi:MAG: hypothetical protein IH590_19060 [Aquamicrobium sp.]|nr:hypothetical protein [Aquamicrobium sp.]
MMMARPSSSAVPALFVWREQAEIARLQAQRDELIARIGRLRPHCHRRIELQTRLQAITMQQLALQTKIGERR